MIPRRLVVYLVVIGVVAYLGLGKGDFRDKVINFKVGGFNTDERKLKELYQELEIKEAMLEEMRVKIDQILANPPSCPQGVGTVTIEGEPLGDMETDIESVKERIAELEEG